ncbi:hypothetical protein P4S68_17420 [Pseudoalteromonas sp. Hal099]
MIDPSADNNWRFSTVTTSTELNVVFRTSPLDEVATIASSTPCCCAYSHHLKQTKMVLRYTP